MLKCALTLTLTDRIGSEEYRFGKTDRGVSYGTLTVSAVVTKGGQSYLLLKLKGFVF